MEQSAYLSKLFGRACWYIQYFTPERGGILDIYNLEPADEIIQSGFLEQFANEYGIDVEEDYLLCLQMATSIEELPPKLQKFISALEKRISDDGGI